MTIYSQNAGLNLANDIAASGRSTFTFQDAKALLKKSTTATANVLERMVAAGLVDRVRHGRYALRSLGVLGTPAPAEDIAMAVGAAFGDKPHRLGYRSALYEHDLIVHPSSTIQVALTHRVRTVSLSGYPLKTILEKTHQIAVGATSLGQAQVSDLERSLLDVANRPNLVGGIEVLAQALAASVGRANPDLLNQYARQLNWSAALRRLGSLADALKLPGLHQKLIPLSRINHDLAMEPGLDEEIVWRDPVWRIRWARSVDEIHAVTDQ